MRIILSTLILLAIAWCTNAPGSNNQANNNTTKPAVTGEQRTIAAPTYGTGKTQIEIFADFQCPACIATNDSLQPIFEELAKAGKLTITFRQFPLSMHKNARGDAIAALCSAEQGKYMEYKKALYSLEKTKSGKSVSDSERVALATGLGMDEAKFSTCLSTRAYENQVAADIKLGESKGVTGTPTIYLDWVKLDMGLFRDTAGFRSFLESRIK